MMRRALLLALALLAAAPVFGADEPLVIIVNPDSGVTSLTREQVVHLFMGRQKRLTPSLMALPIEQVAPVEVRTRFYELLVDLPLAQVRAYWARLYFSSQAQPPRQTDTDEETIQVVAANKGAIGFLPLSKVDHRVKPVLQLTAKR